jgi:hypothetical protein
MNETIDETLRIASRRRASIGVPVPFGARRFIVARLRADYTRASAQNLRRGPAATCRHPNAVAHRKQPVK